MVRDLEGRGNESGSRGLCWAALFFRGFFLPVRGQPRAGVRWLRVPAPPASRRLLPSSALVALCNPLVPWKTATDRPHFFSSFHPRERGVKTLVSLFRFTRLLLLFSHGMWCLDLIQSFNNR